MKEIILSLLVMLVVSYGTWFTMELLFKDEE